MSDVGITLVGDEQLAEALEALDYATQQKFLKAILRDTSTKTVVPFVKRFTPQGQTGNLKKSIGHVAGKSKRKATLFVGPRMSHGKSRRGEDGYKGWVANILEFAKDDDRTPENAKAFKPFSGTAAGPQFFKKVGPIKKKTNLTWAISSRMGAAEVHITKAVRTVLTRAWKRKTKAGLSGYAQTKGRE